MPDLAIMTAWVCESIEHFETEVSGSKGATYTVAYGSHHKRQHMVDHDWSCTCPAYRFQSGYCKHIEAVKASGQRCAWNAALDPTAEPARDDEGNPVCPNCGGPVHGQPVAV